MKSTGPGFSSRGEKREDEWEGNGAGESAGREEGDSWTVSRGEELERVERK